MKTETALDDFARKVMEGLRLAVKKVYEEAGKNKQAVVISHKGEIKHVYPKEDGSFKINE
jgi:hypothetical protein